MKDEALTDFEFLSKMVIGIGEVAEVTGVPTRQIRYWEDKGIIESVSKEGSKNRRYDYYQIKKMLLIKELMDEGYTLDAAVTKTAERLQHFNQMFEELKKVSNKNPEE